MLKDYFSSKTCTIFKSFESDYGFSCSKNETEIKYSSYKIDFSVYLENNFEINIVFQLDDKRFIYINDIVDFLNSKNAGKIQCYKNQVSTKDCIDFVLSSAYDLLEHTFSAIESDNTFLENVYDFTKAKTEKLYNEHILNEIHNEFDEKWKANDYAGYMQVYEKYKKIFTSLDSLLTDLQKKRLLYSKKKCE